MRPSPGNDLILGKLPGRDRSLGLSRTVRDKHLYICGGAGTGKSKFLENLIRQDIRNWSKRKCGMIVIDPHGNLYDNLINWLAWTGLERPIVPIDLRQDAPRLGCAGALSGEGRVCKALFRIKPLR